MVHLIVIEFVEMFAMFTERRDLESGVFHGLETAGAADALGAGGLFMQGHPFVIEVLHVGTELHQTSFVVASAELVGSGEL